MIIVNHKSNLNYNEIIEYEKIIRDLDIIILPTLCYLPSVINEVVCLLVTNF